jgi:two-component system, NarL family, invasion response regulator UvrY
MITVIIVDDHSVVRRGIRQIIESTEDIVVVAEFDKTDLILDTLKSYPRGVLILDIMFSGRQGIDVIKDIKKQFPYVAVLVFSMYSEEQFGIRALHNGASGYLSKDSDPEEILKAIRRVSNGRKYISYELAELLENKLHRDVEKLPHETLSERELAVFYGITSGKKIGQIADELFLSPKTVSNYRMRLLSKLKLKSNVDIIRYAHFHNLIKQ